MRVGYARTSTVEQIAGLEAQEKELKASGVEKLFSERISSVAKRENSKPPWISAGKGMSWL